MAVSKEEILETLSNMTVMEVVDLIAAMEEKFGVSAAAAVAAAPAATSDAGAEAAVEQDEFDVIRSLKREFINSLGEKISIQVVARLNFDRF